MDIEREKDSAGRKIYIFMGREERVENIREKLRKERRGEGKRNKVLEERRWGMN